MMLPVYNEKKMLMAGRNVTLDIAGLGKAERAAGSKYLGGMYAEVVRFGKQVDYQKIGHVVFRWGDPMAKETIDHLLSYYDPQDQRAPFEGAAVVGNDLWRLEVKPYGYDPQKAHGTPEAFTEIPYDMALGEVAIKEWQRSAGPFPTTAALGRVGMRWMAFDQGIKLLSK